MFLISTTTTNIRHNEHQSKISKQMSEKIHDRGILRASPNWSDTSWTMSHINGKRSTTTSSTEFNNVWSRSHLTREVCFRHHGYRNEKVDHFIFVSGVIEFQNRNKRQNVEVHGGASRKFKSGTHSFPCSRCIRGRVVYTSVWILAISQWLLNPIIIVLPLVS